MCSPFQIWKAKKFGFISQHDVRTMSAMAATLARSFERPPMSNTRNAVTSMPSWLECRVAIWKKVVSASMTSAIARIPKRGGATSISCIEKPLPAARYALWAEKYSHTFTVSSIKKPPTLAVFCDVANDYALSSVFSVFSVFAAPSSLRERPRRCSSGSTETMRNFMTSPGFANFVGSSTGLSESSETCARP